MNLGSLTQALARMVAVWLGLATLPWLAASIEGIKAPDSSPRDAITAFLVSGILLGFAYVLWARPEVFLRSYSQEASKDLVPLEVARGIQISGITIVAIYFLLSGTERLLLYLDIRIRFGNNDLPLMLPLADPYVMAAEIIGGAIVLLILIFSPATLGVLRRPQDYPSYEEDEQNPASNQNGPSTPA